MKKGKREINGVLYQVLTDADNSSMASLAVGQEFIVPANPSWIVAPTARNTNSGMRVILVTADASAIAMQIFRGQISRKDRASGEWAYDNEIAKAMNRGHVAFNQMCAGKKIKIVEDVDVSNYDYTDAGEPKYDAEGNRVLVPAKAYKWEVIGDATEDELTSANDKAKDYAKTNFAIE
jgi:hypothetical protein